MLLMVKWQDKIPDTKVLSQTSMPTIYTLLKVAKLRWAGHVVCMHIEKLPQKILFGESVAAMCSQGGQKKRYKDTLKATKKLESLTVD